MTWDMHSSFEVVEFKNIAGVWADLRPKNVLVPQRRHSLSEALEKVRGEKITFTTPKPENFRFSWSYVGLRSFL